MEPILDHSPLENQSQPISIQTDGGIENNPIKTPNTIKIGLFIFLGIIVFLIVALGYAASNYQGIPKEISSNETLSAISKSIFGQQSVSQTVESSNTTNASDSEKGTEMIVTNPENGTDTALPDSADGSGTMLAQGEDITELSPDTGNQETPPESIPSDTTEVSSENAIILDACADGSCKTVCPESTIWNGESCQELTSLKLTENKAPEEIANNQIVFAAGGYNGIKQPGKYIDDSGHDTTVFNVSVNYSDKPVVLVLGAYEPSIWNIRIAKGTRLEKIILGGYHQQIVTGIFKTIPVEKHIYQESKTNDYFYISKGETTKSSLKRFGEIETLYYPNEKGNIEIGNVSTAETIWIQDPTNTAYENYYKKGAELGGEPGLDYLIQKGVLRVATQEDAKEWFEELKKDPNSYFSKKEGYPITDPDDLAILRNKYTPKGGGSNYYVALKDFTLPSGMYWKFSFYVPKGITIRGDISNGSIYDYNNMECRGSCIGTR